LPILPQPWRYSISEDKRRQFDLLREFMRSNEVSEVINACDAGREGELIFRTVYALSGCTKPMKRLWISSMEDKAVWEGFENLRHGSEHDALYESALCRSIRWTSSQMALGPQVNAFRKKEKPRSFKRCEKGLRSL